MTTEKFVEIMNSGTQIKGGSEVHLKMFELSQEAMRVLSEINGKYHSPKELHLLMEKLTGRKLEPFGLFPPIYTDCGKNLHIGKNVFINCCCKFQDQGGIYIGEGTQIGHNTVFATLNHGFLPEERLDLIPRSIHIGKNVWIGANCTILSGVTIGDNAVIGAGSVVTKDIPENMIAVGVPAKIQKSVYRG